MKKIAIVGAGGFGREVAMLIEQINEKNKEWEILGFYDDGIEKNNVINKYVTLGSISEINSVNEELYVVLAIGNPKTKKKILELINNPNIKYPVLIHPSAWIGDKQYVEIGEGSLITAACILTVNITIGKHVIFNLGCTVGHDTIVKDFCSFMPSVNISGEVVINDCVYAGTGAKIINQIEIGENTIIGAGAVAAKSLPANCTAVGVPAKAVKFNN